MAKAFEGIEIAAHTHTHTHKIVLRQGYVCERVCCGRGREGTDAA